MRTLSRTVYMASILLLALLIAPNLNAQDDGTLSGESDTFVSCATLTGEVRHRFELDSRFNDSGNVDGYTDSHYLRTRLTGTFEPIQNITGVITVQDSRSFGDSNPFLGRGTLDASAEAIGVYEAYFRIDDFFGSGLGVQAGRMGLPFGNQRLVGNVGWSNVGRSFDAVKVDGIFGNADVDVFAARLVTQDGGITSQNFYGAWGEIPFVDELTGEFFVLHDNDTRQTTDTDTDEEAFHLNRTTAGAYLHGSVAPISYSGEFAIQTGGVVVDETGGTFHDINSMMFSVNASVDIDPVKVGALFTVLNGDDGDPVGDFEAFNTLFATNHKFYGFMDYFPGTSPSLGLQDIAFSLDWTISSQSDLALDFHMLSSHVEVLGESEYGKEIDLVFNHAYNDVVAFQLGASVFLAETMMESVIGKDISGWGYIMTTVTLPTCSTN